MRSGTDFLDIGNYSYTIPAGRNSNTYTYGFVAIKLDRMVPHLVLDSRTYDFAGISQLPVGFARSQVLSLEGGFDDWVFLYRFGGFDLADPDTMGRLFRIIDTVGERMLRRSGAYSDSRMSVAEGYSAPSRLAMNLVSADGARLKSAPPRVLIVAIIVRVVVIVVPVVTGIWFTIAQALG